MELKETYADRAIHETWESVYRANPYQDEFNDRIMDRIMEALAPSSGDLFLVAGCGVGDHSVRIARRGLRCIGVDISETILEDARNRIISERLEGKISFQTERLEHLSFADCSFDFVHCRGVLMHIPDWERALGELSRVLKPGGKLVILEANQSSVEASLVGLLRNVSPRKSRLVRTPGGLEFWSDHAGNPFLARIANLKYLSKVLEANAMRVSHRFATEFWDLNRSPRGIIRQGVIALNRLYFAWRLPAQLSVGNAIVAVKLHSYANPSHRRGSDS
jgi:ubiquinone/menaquinone biosynthesis C-methylase UbiE